MGLFKQAASSALNTTEKIIGKDWLAQIDKGDEEPLIALLLISTPDLRQGAFVIALGPSFSILEPPRAVADGKTSYSLRKLHSVDLEFTGRAYDEEILNLEYVRRFAALSSVTSIYSYLVGSDSDDLLYNFPSDIDTTNVTNLSFMNCHINPKTMFEFLFTTLNLQNFFYSPKKLVGNPASFDPLLDPHHFIGQLPRHT